MRQTKAQAACTIPGSPPRKNRARAALPLGNLTAAVGDRQHRRAHPQRVQRIDRQPVRDRAVLGAVRLRRQGRAGHGHHGPQPLRARQRLPLVGAHRHLPRAAGGRRSGGRARTPHRGAAHHQPAVHGLYEPDRVRCRASVRRHAAGRAAAPRGRRYRRRRLRGVRRARRPHPRQHRRRAAARHAAASCTRTAPSACSISPR